MTTSTKKAPAVTELSARVMALAGTSAKIRALHLEGLSRGAIKAWLAEYGVTTKDGEPIRYQHVRNVLITPVKKA